MARLSPSLPLVLNFFLSVKTFKLGVIVERGLLIPVIFVGSFPDWFKYFLFVSLYLYQFRGSLDSESEHTLDFLDSHLFMYSFHEVILS